MTGYRCLQIVKAFCLCLFLVSLAAPAMAKHKHPEKFYQLQWCLRHFGETEYMLPDKTRVDCVTQTHAIEFDFANKWAEAIGQALHYGRMTGLRPGIVLILEKPYHHEKVFVLDAIIRHYKLPIDVWTIVNSGKQN